MMHRVMNIFLVVVFTFSNFPLSHFLVQDEPILQAGIQNFGWLLNQLSSFEEFNQGVPLSNVTPAEVLQLDQLFSMAFAEIPLQVATTPISFAEELGWSEDDVAEISVVLDTDNGSKTAVVTLHVEKREVLQIAYLNQPEEHTGITPTESGTCEDFISNDDDELIDGDDPDCAYITIIGGEVPTTFELNTTLTFVEEEVGEGESVVYLDMDADIPPVINLSYNTVIDDQVGPVQVDFDSVFNIADIDVTGSGKYDVEIEALIIDENNDGKVTIGDWTNSILDDFIQMNYLKNEVVFGLDLTLDGDTFDSGSGAGTLTLSHNDPSSVDMLEIGLDPDGLEAFLTIDSDALLTGLGSYAVALDTMWIAAEGEIPFIEERFHNLSGSEDPEADQLLPGDSIRSLLERQGDALVYCTTEEVDQKYDAYCQAFTSQEPTDDPETGWALAGYTVEYTGDLVDTIGISPTGWAKFAGLENEEEWKNIEVTYFYDDEKHVVEPRIKSIGDLKERLKLLPGMNDVTVEYNYTPELSSLVIDIDQNIPQDMTAGEINFAFGDQLQKYTGISNVHPSSAQIDSPSMDISPVNVHAGYGIILVDDVSKITPTPNKWEGADSDSCTDGNDNDGDGWVDMYDLDCPKLQDRFFIEENPDGGAEIDVGGLAINVPDDYQMEGMVGAVAVDIVVNEFSISAAPALKVDIIPAPIEVEDALPIEDAVGARKIISNPCIDESNCEEDDINILREQNLSANGNLTVTSGLLALSETVTIDPAADPEITTEGDPLQSLDIVPSVIGQHIGDMDNMVLKDDDNDPDTEYFYDYLDVQQGDFVSKTIYNLTNGSSCTGFTVLNANELECSSPLAGNEAPEDNQWNPGDKYIIQGDPRALLTLTEDSLYSLAGELKNLAETREDLPIFGKNMGDLAPQFSEVMNAISNIRNGDPSTEIFCEIAEEEVDDELQPIISCFAVSQFDPSDVVWTITNGSAYENATDLGTVYQSENDTIDKKVKFKITGLIEPEDLAKLSVTLQLTHEENDESIVDRITYPYQQPQTLQGFKDDFEWITGGTLGFRFSAEDNLVIDFIDDHQGESQKFLLRSEIEATEGGNTELYQLLQLPDDEENQLDMSIDSNFSLVLEIPLEKHTALQDVDVLSDTGVSVTASVNETEFDFTASIGGLEVEIGTSAEIDTSGDNYPEISLEVAQDKQFYDDEGESVGVTFTIKNTGTVQISSPFDVYNSAGETICTIDPSVPVVLEPDPNNSGNPDSQVNCPEQPYPLPVLDLPDFAFAQADYYGTLIQSQRETITVPRRLDLEVTASPLVYETGGTDITVKYSLTNNGDEPLSDVILSGNSTCLDDLPIDPLGPGNISCEDSYTGRTEDLDIDVQVTAVAPEPSPDPGTPVCIEIIPGSPPTPGQSGSCPGADIPQQNSNTDPKNPTIEIDSGIPVSSQLVQFTITEGVQEAILKLEAYPEYDLLFSAEGDIIEIPFKVINDGNVTIDGPISIIETSGSPDVGGNCAPLVDPSDSLGPDQSKTCVFEYQVTSDDVSNQLINKTFKIDADIDPPPSDEITLTAENIAYQSITATISKAISFSSTQDLGDLEPDPPINPEDPPYTIEEFSVLINMKVSDDAGGDVTFRIPANSYPIEITPQIKSALDLVPMELSLVKYAMPMLGDVLEQDLDADLWDHLRIPMAGSNLAAGIEFSVVVNTLNDVLETYFDDDWDSSTETFENLCDALGEDYTVRAWASDTDPETPYSCINQGDLELNDIKDIQFDLNVEISEGDAIPETIPFDTGLPGVPLESTDDEPILATSTYTMNAVFGLDRSSGPYIMNYKDEQQNALPLLELDSTLSMDLGDNCTIGDNDFPSTLDDAVANVVPDRCMNGVIGLILGKLYDTGSSVELHLTADIDEDKLGYADYMYGLGLSAPVLTNSHGITSGNVDLLFKTTISVLPTVAGEIHLSYTYGSGNPEEMFSLLYDNIYMKVNYVDFMGPAVQEVQTYTKPLQPVVDTLTTPLPVISDLSTMVGQGPVSLLSIMQEIPSNKLTMITRLAEMISFVNNIPADASGIWMGLAGDEDTDEAGEFGIDISTVINEECAKEIEKTGDTTSEACDPDAKYKKLKDMAQGKGKDKKLKKNIDDPEVDWSGAGITMPILSDTTQIYGMLMGIDATLIRVDLGTLSASAGLEYSYGPFMVGPVPVSITIGGTVTLEGRFAIGFDTLGLRSTLSGGSFADNDLTAGIFIDDLDLSGSDVPEIKLEVEVYAGAAVSIRIIEAGIRAGVRFGIELNWNDPNDDGKIRLDEIGIWRAKPICLFDRRGYIGFYLEFYLKFDFGLFSTTISWRPIDKEYDLFNESCAPPEPELAVVQEDLARLYLYMGSKSNRDTRAVYQDEINEKFVVRQLTERGKGCKEVEVFDESGAATVCPETTETWGTWVSVTFQGIQQHFFLNEDGPEDDENVKHYRIYAEAEGGNDQISLLPGAITVEDLDGNKTTVEILFTIPAELYGGPGNDRFDTGNGDDIVYGDHKDTINDACPDLANDDEGNGDENAPEDNDQLTGRGGGDKLFGGCGIDNLDGGLGNDDLYGGGDQDIINGGPGTDYIFGGDGDDSLFGGPGLSDDFEDDTLWDRSDYIIGGSGEDTLEGGFGDDYLFGDILDGIANADDLRDNLAAAWETIDQLPGEAGESNDDKLIGGEDDDYLYGGPGNDTLEGGKGSDELFGQVGHDDLFGGRGEDFLFGGTGHDWLQGDQGNDELYGDIEKKYVEWSEEDKLVEGDQGDDDDLIGGDGQDILFGNGGSNILLGDNGTILDHDLTDGTPIPHRFNDGLSETNLEDTLEGFHDGEVPGPALIDNEADFLNVFEIEPEQYVGKTIFNLTDGSSCFGFIVEDANKLTCTNGLEGGIENLWHQDDQYKIEADLPVQVGTVYGAHTGEASENSLTLQESEINFLNLFGVGPGKEILKTIYNMSDGSSCFGFVIVDEHTITCNSSLQGGDDNLWETDDLYAIEGDTLANVQPMTDETGDPNISPDEYNDYLVSGSGHDFMFGEAGSDMIYGGMGNDYQEGNAGDDRMDGNDGSDNMLGGPGNDVMYGGGGWAYPDDIYPDDPDDSENRHLENLHDQGDLADRMWGNSGDDFMYGNLGDDQMRGNTGNDNIEGNADSDTIHGGPGDDDIIGGSNEEKQADEGDLLYGDDGEDIILGDNGTIIYIDNPNELTYEYELDTFGDEAPFHIASGISVTRVNREAVMLDDPNDISGYAGSDWIEGGNGDDQIFGQFDNTEDTGIGDELFGQAGQDLIVGDQGTAACSENTGEGQEVLRTNAPFLIDDIYVANTLQCTVTTQSSEIDGADWISGGDNADWLYGVGGVDVINGNSGNDRIFGGNGNDRIWGGPHHDHLWGGAGDDLIDVFPRDSYTVRVRRELKTIPADPPEYFVWAGEEPLHGFDYMYGGLGRDAMQADNSEYGIALGDRMIDWIGVYNIYYLCTAQYGESVITRSPSPQVINFLIGLAGSDGADTPSNAYASGYEELAIVYKEDYQTNTNPPHDDTPGHFTCLP